MSPLLEMAAGSERTACNRLLCVPQTTVGGLRIAVLDRTETARLMIEMAIRRRGMGIPLLMSSANGEVLSRCASDAHLAQLMAEMDLVNADGQPLVLASRLLCRTKLPERVATTDLFHDVASLAMEHAVTFYMLGAMETENRRAIERVRQVYPSLSIVGHCHGYLSGDALARKVEEINSLAPDIVWVALGVPREQEFCSRFRQALCNVGIIKTSGGLFNFLSGARKRAPAWMQKSCLEWMYRTKEEPRRLFWRYFITSPHALLLLITRSA